MTNAEKNRRVAELIDKDGDQPWVWIPVPRDDGDALWCNHCRAFKYFKIVLPLEYECPTCRERYSSHTPLNFCADPVAAWKLLEWVVRTTMGVVITEGVGSVNVKIALIAGSHSGRGKNISGALVDAIIPAMEGRE